MFNFDGPEIVAHITIARADLLARRDTLLTRLPNVPAVLDTNDLVRRTERFVALLKALQTAVRAARLADRTPFTDGGKAVDAFYAEQFRGVAPAMGRLTDVLNETASRARAQARAVTPPVPRSTAGEQRLDAIPARADPPATLAAAMAATLPTTWAVLTVDRASLDLEALRHLFTDYELQRVVARHLTQHGPAPLRGATYHEVVEVRAARPGTADT